MPRMDKIGKTATSIYSENKSTVVKYHWTPVVTFNDKCITLNSGGWHTNTTKNRMNQTARQFNLDYCVFQRDYSWFVGYKGKELPFYDNMILKR